ncbi:MAG: AraC family transcriptional regulator [Marinomonas sp.]|uniref:AraC family transcriptional regulator n=1 Tax=unclassified Marinomonas TaxID=196814 RepID=UPI0007AF6586|nr:MULTISPECIES: helix-turn-helix domain-containing protein [unclassified Marinomonas]KZM39258.1 hypothetical protein OA92_20400 [Marinomonas sp. SBI22]KZM40195.1 hypothetical protein OA91_20460 [Marinomonas sp. SBI8L]
MSVDEKEKECKVSKAKAFLVSLVNEINQHDVDVLGVQFLSEKLGLSRWQLQRTFSALVGISLKEHLRERRICYGAKLLLETNQGVLDVALASGFSSQAAFSRAFKTHFTMTPVQYRQRAVVDKVSFDLFIPKHYKWSKAMTIKVEHKSAILLEGVQGYFNGFDSSKANNLERIPKLWQSLMQDDVFIKQANLIGYGLIYESDDKAKGDLAYLAAIDSSQAQMHKKGIKKEVNEQLYAIIPHHGKLSDLSNTLDAFCGQWLVESDYKMSSDFSIEVYDERFDPDSENSYFETWIPVQTSR